MTCDSSHRFSVAPMMAWTDRHCRVFHRCLTRRARLYTEMVTAAAVIHGDRQRLLGFSHVEHPLALQVGGADPAQLALAAQIGADCGYDEINLNVGCPSDRVQSGRFGACLMREPDLVARCVAAMKARVQVPVTVKCRIGVDDQVPAQVLPRFAARLREAGADRLIVHARMAWLKGLSPKENRDIPPLDYPLVYALKRQNPGWSISINGGVRTLNAAKMHLDHVDGVMMGRAAYNEPYILAQVDAQIFADAATPPDRHTALEAFLPHVERELTAGTRLAVMARPILGLFHGVPGARAFRRHVSQHMYRDDAGLEVITEAMAQVPRMRADRAPATSRSETRKNDAYGVVPV